MTQVQNIYGSETLRRTILAPKLWQPWYAGPLGVLGVMWNAQKRRR